jgi:hypothetical protein
MVVGLAPSQLESEREGGPHTTGYSSELNKYHILSRACGNGRISNHVSAVEMVRYHIIAEL